MKKYFTVTLILLCVLVCTFTGCKNNESSVIKQDDTVKTEIEAALTKLPSETIKMLYDGENSLTYFANNNKIYVTAKTTYDYLIPLVAKDLSPIVKDVATKNKYEFDITIAQYSQNSATGKSDITASWHSTDGEVGFFSKAENSVMKSNVTIDDMYEMYSKDIAKWNGEVTPTDEALSVFQGKWIREKMEWFELIVSGDEISIVEYYDQAKTRVDDVDSYTLDIDENGSVIACHNHKTEHPEYILVKTDDGKLQITEIEDNKISLYNYVGEATEVPKEATEPKIGMTKDEVLKSTWGNPKKRNITETKNGTHEQWVYDKGYIYFDNGLVSTIQR